MVPAVISWNEGIIGDTTGRALDDPRVSVSVGDVGRMIRAYTNHWDAILLDVDNGPESLSHPDNAWLYGYKGLKETLTSLRPHGVLAVWSAGDDEGFTQRLKKSGFEVDVRHVRAREKRKGARHTIWLGPKSRVQKLSMQSLDAPQGIFHLARFPLRRRETLRAWDAADEYCLKHIHEHNITGQRWAILNDGFGALQIALSEYDPVSIGDSEMARLALNHNRAQNELPPVEENFIDSLGPWPSTLDVVVIKVPKVLSLLEFQLQRLRPSLGPSTVVIGAGMTRDVHTSTIKAFEQFIGPTTTSLARKKARLILATPNPDLQPELVPDIKVWSPPEISFELHEYPGIFSRGKFDQGTRLLLEHLPPIESETSVVDLGCGNGIVGLSMIDAQPECVIEFIDESYLAVASARAGFSALNANDNRAKFSVAHGLTQGQKKSVDLVVCNPPFHQGRATGDHLAWAMFTQAHRALKPGGELRIVGNRHLGYHTSLKRIFGHCETVASNRKFVVLSARRRSE